MSNLRFTRTPSRASLAKKEKKIHIESVDSFAVGAYGMPQSTLDNSVDMGSELIKCQEERQYINDQIGLYAEKLNQLKHLRQTNEDKFKQLSSVQNSFRQTSRSRSPDDYQTFGGAKRHVQLPVEHLQSLTNLSSGVQTLATRNSPLRSKRLSPEAHYNLGRAHHNASAAQSLNDPLPCPLDSVRQKCRSSLEKGGSVMNTIDFPSARPSLQQRNGYSMLYKLPQEQDRTRVGAPISSSSPDLMIIRPSNQDAYSEYSYKKERYQAIETERQLLEARRATNPPLFEYYERPQTYRNEPVQPHPPRSFLKSSSEMNLSTCNSLPLRQTPRQEPPASQSILKKGGRHVQSSAAIEKKRSNSRKRVVKYSEDYPVQRENPATVLRTQTRQSDISPYISSRPGTSLGLMTSSKMASNAMLQMGSGGNLQQQTGSKPSLNKGSIRSRSRSPSQHSRKSGAHQTEEEQLVSQLQKRLESLRKKTHQNLDNLFDDIRSQNMKKSSQEGSSEFSINKVSKPEARTPYLASDQAYQDYIGGSEPRGSAQGGGSARLLYGGGINPAGSSSGANLYGGSSGSIYGSMDLRQAQGRMPASKHDSRESTIKQLCSPGTVDGIEATLEVDQQLEASLPQEDSRFSQFASGKQRPSPDENLRNQVQGSRTGSYSPILPDSQNEFAPQQFNRDEFDRGMADLVTSKNPTEFANMSKRYNRFLLERAKNKLFADEDKRNTIRTILNNAKGPPVEESKSRLFQEMVKRSMSPKEYWEPVPKGFKGTRLQYFVYKKQEEMIDKLRKSGRLQNMSIQEKTLLNNTDLKTSDATKFLKKSAIDQAIGIHCRREHRHDTVSRRSPDRSEISSDLINPHLLSSRTRKQKAQEMKDKVALGLLNKFKMPSMTSYESGPPEGESSSVDPNNSLINSLAQLKTMFQTQKEKLENYGSHVKANSHGVQPMSTAGQKHAHFE